jgi:hypothetical protein
MICTIAIFGLTRIHSGERARGARVDGAPSSPMQQASMAQARPGSRITSGTIIRKRSSGNGHPETKICRAHGHRSFMVGESGRREMLAECDGSLRRETGLGLYRAIAART